MWVRLPPRAPLFLIEDERVVGPLLSVYLWCTPLCKRTSGSRLQALAKSASDRDERLKEIAREYAAKPQGTLVVSPDNESRRAINQVIHREMQTRGQVDANEQKYRVLIARQEITGADRQWAAQYEPEDVVRYARGSKTHGIEAGEYARVERVNELARQISNQENSWLRSAFTSMGSISTMVR